MHLQGTCAAGAARAPGLMMAARWTALRVALGLVAMLCAPFVSLQAEPVKAQHLTVELVSDAASVAPGERFHLGLNFVLDRGWHVYWQNAGDSGEPPEVKWHLPSGLTAGALRFPVPRRLPLGPLMDYGYEDQVLFPVDAVWSGAGASQSASGAPNNSSALNITGDVRWLVCRESCIPGKATLTLRLPAGGATANATTAKLFEDAAARLPVPLPGSVEVGVAATEKTFVITLRKSSRQKTAEFYPFDAEQIANAAVQRVEPLRDGVRVTVEKTDTLAKNPTQLHGLLKLADTAYEFQAPVTVGAAAEPEAHETGARQVLGALGLAFVGGLLLNLMPCVFPVLFLKGLALVSSSGEERRRMRLHGAMYTLGIVVSFWLVVAVLLALRAGGGQLGWGFQFQSPAFVAVMASLLFFLGLSLAGVFDVGLSLTSAGGQLAARGGLTGSFFTGVLATVVATPCTAPFMGAAIGFALAQPAGITFIIFTALALGLAAPYLLLTIQPAWTRLLPRPGVWMEHLKVATAVPIFATVVWLVWLYTVTAGANALVALLGAFLVLAVAAWVMGRWPARRLGSGLAAVLAVAAVVWPVVASRHPAARPSTGASAAGAEGSRLDWQPYSAATLAAVHAQGKTAFVDFTADWCLSCQVNERVVLNSAQVRSRFADAGIVLLKADWTWQDPEITSALAALGRSGVPAYAVYPPGSAPPRLLPEVLTTGMVLEAVSDSRKAATVVAGGGQ